MDKRDSVKQRTTWWTRSACWRRCGCDWGTQIPKGQTPKKQTGPIGRQPSWILRNATDIEKLKMLCTAVVENRSADTLLRNIKERVRKGGRVQTNSWRSYVSLKSMGYSHETVNHKRSFVKRTRHGIVTTNTIESTHSAIKKRARQLNVFQGTKSSNVDPKIQELTYRFNNRGKDMFLCILSHLYSFSLLHHHGCILSTLPL